MKAYVLSEIISKIFSLLMKEVFHVIFSSLFAKKCDRKATLFLHLICVWCMLCKYYTLSYL